MEDISISSIIPINQNFEALQAENLNLKKSNRVFLIRILILGMITVAVYYSNNRSVEDEQK